jgi:hypothetical protein
MTNTQFLVVIGTIWVAPHAPPWYSVMAGMLHIFVAALIGLGVFA